MSKDVLTDRQRKFVELYNGNATDAARKAGFTGKDSAIRQTASELMAKPHIKEAIRQRQEQEQRPGIVNRVALQMFWTEVMQDKTESMKHRLKASELLGKSHGAFLERHELSGKDGEPLSQVVVVLPSNGREKAD